MRNLKLVDAVIALHDIARLVEEEVGRGLLAEDIRNCADRLHDVSIYCQYHHYYHYYHVLSVLSLLSV